MQVALHFVQDDRARFDIAIECGNIEVALQTAQRLDDKSIIHRLGLEAFRHGNLEIVEWCFQQTKAYERLSFLYTVNGNTEKLAKMLKIAEMRGNVMSRYQNALYSGSARARVAILKDAGNIALAYVCAKTHGLEDEAAALAEVLGDKLPEVSADAAAMMPPTPILRHGNWPLLEVTASMFEGKLAGERAAGGVGGAGVATGGASAAGAEIGEADLEGGWGDDDLALLGEEGDAAAAPPRGSAGDDEDGGWDMEVRMCWVVLALPLFTCLLGKEPIQGRQPVAFWSCHRLCRTLSTACSALHQPSCSHSPDTSFVAHRTWTCPRTCRRPPPPPPAPSPRRRRASPSRSAGSRAPSSRPSTSAAGAFDSAFRMLSLQLGITNFEPLKPHMLALHAAAFAHVAGLPGLPAMSLGLDATWSKTATTAPPTNPATPFKLAGLEKRMQEAYECVTKNKLQDALAAFDAILLVVPLLVVETRREVDEVKELITIVREYHTGIRCELEHRSVRADPLRLFQAFRCSYRLCSCIPCAMAVWQETSCM